MAYAKILVAIDLTDEADEVLAAARDVAGANTAEVTVLTVVKPLTHVYGGLDMAPVSNGSIAFEQEALAQAHTQLKALAAQYGVKEDHTRVMLGAPAHEIRSMAESLQADLIVMGTHGRHGLGRLLGSTANAVLHGVPCDVLAVRIHPAG